MYHTAKSARKNRAAKGWLLAAAVLLLAGWIALHGLWIVTDGEAVYPCYAFFRTPAQILEQVGVPMDPLDGTKQERLYGIGYLTVVRAPVVTVYYHGEAIEAAASRGETAAQLLTRLDLLPGKEDVVSLPGDTPLRDGMALSVDQILRRQETYTAVIPAHTEYRSDASAAWGEERVLRPGSDGEARVTADVEYTNALETGRTVLSREVVVPAEDRVVSVGTCQSDPVQKPKIHYEYLLLPDGQMLTYTQTAIVEATAYTGTDAGCNSVTATGTKVHKGTVCVDPNFIPYGTRMFIMSSDGSYVYGIAQAEDCRVGIDGYRVDLFFPTAAECTAFGRQNCTVFFLG